MWVNLQILSKKEIEKLCDKFLKEVIEKKDPIIHIYGAKEAFLMFQRYANATQIHVGMKMILSDPDFYF